MYIYIIYSIYKNIARKLILISKHSIHQEPLRECLNKDDSILGSTLLKTELQQKYKNRIATKIFGKLERSFRNNIKNILRL